jgi:hypothetical protein
MLRTRAAEAQASGQEGLGYEGRCRVLSGSEEVVFRNGQ